VKENNKNAYFLYSSTLSSRNSIAEGGINWFGDGLNIKEKTLCIFHVAFYAIQPFLLALRRGRL
jgi:hypothetical protein